MPGWYELASIFMLLLVLGIAVGSIEQAQWINPQPSLTLVLFLGMITALLLVKIKIPNTLKHGIASFIGIAVMLWQASILLYPTISVVKLEQVITVLFSGLQDLTLINPAEGTIHFATFLIVYTWMMGYLSTWFVLRRQNPWVAVGLGAVSILVNLSNLLEKDYVFFFWYLLAAMLFVGQVSLVKRHAHYKKLGMSYHRGSIAIVVFLLICFSITMTSVVWALPDIPAPQVTAKIDKPFKREIEGFLRNLLKQVYIKKPFLSSYWQEYLLLGDIPDRSNKVIYIITSERPFYWRTRSYDIYSANGWSSSPIMKNGPGKAIPAAEPEKLSNRYTLTHTIVPYLKTDVLPSAGEFISSSMKASVQTLVPIKFILNLYPSYQWTYLPPDVASLERTLKVARTTADVFDINFIKQNLPNDFIFLSTKHPPYDASFDSASAHQQRPALVEITRKLEGRGEVIAATAPQLLDPNDRFTVTSMLSSATAADMRRAGQNYPSRITDYYLQLPSGFPERIKNLAKTVTNDAKTPYDKVLAIKQYLVSIPYTAVAQTPPEGVDGVDFFLHSLQQGNCIYFASTKAVMLRSLGIPSRLVVGYLPGERDANASTYTIRAKDYHAWVDVYFPGYGWIEFDATPVTDSAEINMVDDWLDAETAVFDEGIYDSSESSGHSRWAMILALLSVFGLLLLILVIVTVVVLVYRWLRSVAGLDTVSGIYAQMCFCASLLGKGPKRCQTPFEYNATLASAFPTHADDINTIVQMYVQNRFGQKKIDGAVQQHKLQQSWHSMRVVLLKRLLLFRK